MAKKNTQTPMMRQFHAIKKEHPNDILFFRMGDFYEMMFQDAIEAAEVLGITLTKRGKGTSNEAPMCGVPFHAADGYIAKLVKNGYRVAICEQVEDPKETKGIVKREVVRVVTPSTIMDDQVVEEKEYQFLAALTQSDEGLGCALLEFTTGRFEVCEFLGNDAFQELADLLMSRNPREFLVSEDFDLNWLDPQFTSSRCITKLEAWHFALDYATQKILEHFEVLNLDGLGLRDKSHLIQAAGAALAYVAETQKTRADHIENLQVIQFSDTMVLDGTTQRNLELTRTLFDGNRKESLLGQIDFTETAMGARLLKDWLLAPLMNIEAIQSRQNYISSFVDATIARGEIRNILKGITDLDRQISKLAMQAMNPREVLGLGYVLEQSLQIMEWLDQVIPDRYQIDATDLQELGNIRQKIALTIEEEAPAQLRQGGVIRSGIDEELDELRLLRKDSRATLAKLEQEEREKTGISKLKVQYNKVFGYYIEVSKIHSEKVPENYIRKQTLVNSERYITEELKIYEERILGAEDKIQALEEQYFRKLLSELKPDLPVLKKWSTLLATCDVHQALAELAVVRNYVRPEVNEGQDIFIQDGRHPVIEALSDDPFIANDTTLNGASDQLMIITGPNMGGKSTYLRQVALICLMAQIGSFVPASKAEIGIVDRIFTRVGASDHLAKGQSTFMVEMTETANILNHASQRSLIILDEIGRGTSTFDGLSIAWSCAEYILSQIKAKTLFATHYHEMTEIANLHAGAKNLHITVREWNQKIVFLRRVESGAADQSYGIHVAQLAGLPKQVTSRAREILNNLEKNELDTTGRPKLAQGNYPQNDEVQLSLFGPASSEFEDELRRLDLNDLTPREMMNWLFEWQAKLKDS